LINNPHYTLIIEKGRFAEKYFSSSDPIKNPEGSTLWNRMRSNSKSIESDVSKVLFSLIVLYFTFFSNNFSQHFIVVVRQSFDQK
jgi:hypothetical protein